MALGKILVADDDRNIAELLRLYLEKEGYTTELAADGEEAVAKFNADTPDLVLLDIMMPKLDGWQVCREIRKKSNCPIIMITAKGETFDKVLGLELGADDYVVKPFDAKEIVARIKAVTRRTGKPAVENDVKEVSYDKLTVNMTRYELKEWMARLWKLRPRSWNCSTIWQAIRTVYIPVTSFWMRSGALNIMATAVPWMYISSVCVKSWKAYRISGRSRLSGV